MVQRSWKVESQEACTTARIVCAAVGCARFPYRGGLCSDHWEPEPDKTCRHKSRVLVLCGRCGRRVCEACYGAWNVLACGRCRGV